MVLEYATLSDSRIEPQGLLGESQFWMGDRLATECVEISHDLQDLERPGFWAVMGTFEGQWLLARFRRVIECPATDFFTVESFEKLQPHHGSVNQGWQSQSSQDYMHYVQAIRDSIAQGEAYQVNACRVISHPKVDSLAPLFAAIMNTHSAPYASYLRLPTIEIASASPELFLSVEELDTERRVIRTSPIKGTSTTANFPDKDNAENVMIVDLMRNDLGRICESGSIETANLLRIEAHPGLFHLVSDVVGILKTGQDWSSILAATFPPGSVSGAPKSSAMKIIQHHETISRGPYCGALGWIENGEGVLSVGIRLFWQEREGTSVNFGTGAGITWGSDAQKEWDETELKSARLMKLFNDVYENQP